MYNLMFYSSDSGILMKGQSYRLLIMINLVEVVEAAWMSTKARRANSRMSSKTLPVPPVLENAHIHKLLFKCAKTCSKPVREHTYVILPICVAAKGRQSSLWPKATRL